MARWRLKAAHYLNVPGNEWQHEETDRASGKRLRKMYTVPLLLDPTQPNDWNYKQDEMIVVCHADKGERRDIVFIGPPTPDMEPMDEEAEEISKAESPKWIHPIESLPGQGDTDYGAMMVKAFERQIENLMKNLPVNAAGPVSAGVDPEAFAKLQEQVAQLMARNAELEAGSTRRV